MAKDKSTRNTSEKPVVAQPVVAQPVALERKAELGAIALRCVLADSLANPKRGRRSTMTQLLLAQNPEVSQEFSVAKRENEQAAENRSMLGLDSLRSAFIASAAVELEAITEAEKAFVASVIARCTREAE